MTQLLYAVRENPGKPPANLAFGCSREPQRYASRRRRRDTRQHAGPILGLVRLRPHNLELWRWLGRSYHTSDTLTRIAACAQAPFGSTSVMRTTCPDLRDRLRGRCSP